MQRRADCGINVICFNQDMTCFAVGSDSGVRVFNLDPLVQKAEISYEKAGSISKVDMLHRTNLVAIVSGGKSPKFASNVVRIWDDSRQDFVLEFSMNADVTAVRMRMNMILICLPSEIYVYSFPDHPRRLGMFATRPHNTLGLCEVTRSSCDRAILVFPGRKRAGCVQLADLKELDTSVSSAPVVIDAHQNDLSCLCLSLSGTMVASASVRGTLVRIHDTATRQRLRELRRGSDQAILYCITFDHSGDFISTCSDKGTVHIFAVRDSSLNRRSAFSAVTGMTGLFTAYGESEWGMAQFTIPAELQAQLAFAPPGPGQASTNSIVALAYDGSFHRYRFSAEKCHREQYAVFMDVLAHEDVF